MRRAAVASGDVKYVVRTRHQRPTTYVGAAFDRGRSTVFAFERRDAAARVARGLERHRMTHGRFPALTDELELGPDADEAQLDLLVVETVSDDGLRALVAGSGVAVCCMRLDDAAAGEVRAEVVYGTSVQRVWIDAMYAAPAHGGSDGGADDHAGKDD